MGTVRLALWSVLFCFLAACSLPRGSALRSEIVSEQNAEQPTFQVVNVTRDVTAAIDTWPATGWAGHYHWFSRDSGPQSNVIRTGDKLSIVVWDNQENSLLNAEGSKSTALPVMTVSATGHVFMPYVGQVPVSGLTASGARDRLQARLEPIAPSAQVQISVEEGSSHSVDLVSGVGRPGSYPLENRNTTILSMLAQGGGIMPSLRNPIVRLQRGGKTYNTPAASLLEEAWRNVRVQGGDQIIVVQDERSFNALGASGEEKIIHFEQEDMSALEALSAMGGLQDSRANPKGILVLREYRAKDLKPGMAGPDMQQVVFVIDLTSADGLFAARNFDIHPDDTVLVTESAVTSVQTVFGLVGRIFGLTAQANNL